MSVWAYQTALHDGITDVCVRRMGGCIDSVMISTSRALTDEEMKAVFELVANFVGVTP